MSKDCPNNRRSPGKAVNNGATGRNFPLKTMSPVGPVAPIQHIKSPASQMKVYASSYAATKLDVPPLNRAVRVVVCYTKSPAELYVQYERFANELIELMKIVQTSMADSPALPANPTEMSPCLAIFNDRNWYRARIVKICEDGGIGVEFVDFGNRIKVQNTRDNLRQLNVELSKQPFYAVKIKLADIEPPDGETWPVQILASFKQLTENKHFLMEIIRIEGDALCVRLKLEDERDVGDLLVERGWAKGPVNKAPIINAPPPGVAPSKLQPVNGTQQPPVTNRLAQLTSKPANQASVSPPSRFAPTATAAAPSQPVAAQPVAPAAANRSPITRFSQPAVAKSSPPKPAVAPQPQPTTVPAQEAPRQPMSAMQLLRSRQVKPSSQSQQGGTNSILDQLKAGDAVMFCIVLPFNSGSSVGSLIRGEDDLLIQASFDDIAQSTGEPLPGFDLKPGSLVAALSPEHKQWFRGCVAKVDSVPFSSYSILYIDFGNVEDGIITVKPVPLNVKNPEIAVKMSFAEPLTPAQEKKAAELLVAESLCNFEIVSKESDGSAIAKWTDDGAPPVNVKLEPWTVLLKKTAQQPIKRDIKSRSWEPGFSEQVSITVAEDVDRIFVQVLSDEIIEKIARISEILKEKFPSSPKFTTTPPVGTYVAALYPADGELYRALVTAVAGDSLKLSYIDWGNSDTVSLSDVRVLPEELYDFPRCCNRVSLGCVSRPAGPLPDAVKSALSTLSSDACSMLVLKNTEEGTECTLSRNGKIFNELVEDLFNPKAPPPSLPMPKLELASPEAPEPPKPEEAKVKQEQDNTLGTFTLEAGPFQELKVGETVSLFCLLSSDGPQILMMMTSDPEILGKLQHLDVSILESKVIFRG